MLILTMRMLGKRQLGEFEPYELALTILLADIISVPIGSVSTPLFYGLIPTAALFCVHSALTFMCMKSDCLRRIISGKPVVVVKGGKVDMKALNRLCLSLSDLIEALRSAGCGDVTDVGAAIIEANGRVSAFAGADVCLPETIVTEGHVQPANLRATGHDEAWLRAQLTGRRIALDSVDLANLSDAGEMRLQLRDGTMLAFRTQ